MLFALGGCSSSNPNSPYQAERIVYKTTPVAISAGAQAPTAEEIRLQCALARKCTKQWQNTQFQQQGGGFSPM